VSSPINYSWSSRHECFGTVILTVILSMQNRPIPSRNKYVTSTVKLLSLAHLYVVWFPEAKGNSRVVWNAGNFYRIAVGDLFWNLFLIILPKTDGGNKRKRINKSSFYKGKYKLASPTPIMVLDPITITYHTIGSWLTEVLVLKTQCQAQQKIRHFGVRLEFLL